MLKLLGYAFGIGLSFLKAWVLMCGWSWFAAPLFGITVPLGLAGALVILITVTFIMPILFGPADIVTILDSFDKETNELDKELEFKMQAASRIIQLMQITGAWFWLWVIKLIIF